MILHSFTFCCFFTKLGTFGKTFLSHSPDQPPSNCVRGRVWYDGLCMTQSYTVLLHEPLLNILWSVNHSSEDTITADLTRFWTKYNQIIEKRMVWAQSKGQIWYRYTEKPTNLSLSAKENNFSYRCFGIVNHNLCPLLTILSCPLFSPNRTKTHHTGGLQQTRFYIHISILITSYSMAISMIRPKDENRETYCFGDFWSGQCSHQR